MKKLLIAQIAFMVVSVFACLVIGMQIFGLGRIDPDALLPWAYVLAAAWGGMMICLVARVSIRLRRLEKKLDKLDEQG